MQGCLYTRIRGGLRAIYDGIVMIVDVCMLVTIATKGQGEGRCVVSEENSSRRVACLPWHARWRPAAATPQAMPMTIR